MYSDDELKQDLKGVEEILRNLSNIAELVSNDKLQEIASRLNDPVQFWTIQPEIEWASILKDANIQGISIEPFYPKAGPDLHARLISRSVYFEIKAPWGLREDYKVLLALGKVKEVLNKFPNYQKGHVHLIDTFNLDDYDPFIRTIKSVLQDKPYRSFTLYYSKKNHYLIDPYFYSPFNLVASQVNPEKIWIRRNFYQLYPVAVYPSWINAIQGYRNDVHRGKIDIRRKALFAVDVQPEDGEELRRRYALNTWKDRRVRYKSIHKRLKNVKRQLPAGCPCIVVMDLSHLTIMTEIDILCAFFGESYTRQLLAYSMGIGNRLHPDPIICQSPSHISALICYYRWLDRSIARLYSNPKASIPLNDEEIQILTSGLPCNIESLKIGYSHKTMMPFCSNELQSQLDDNQLKLLESMYGTPIFHSPDEAQQLKLLESLFDAYIIHFIDEELIGPGPKVEFRDIHK